MQIKNEDQRQRVLVALEETIRQILFHQSYDKDLQDAAQIKWLKGHASKLQDMLAENGYDEKRQWKIDGMLVNARDAQQCVQSYRAAYSKTRARRLVEQAVRRCHRQECHVVFVDALESLEW